jgi:DNA-binding transcriptional regulator YiaG
MLTAIAINRLAPQEAAQPGRLVGKTRPNHTSVLFEAKAAAASVLSHSRSSFPRSGDLSSANRTRRSREHFGLTQTELAHALGVSLRTVQNWERAGVSGSARQLRDLEELWTIVKDSVKDSDIPAWLRPESDAFAGRRPIELHLPLPVGSPTGRGNPSSYPTVERHGGSVIEAAGVRR